MVELKENLSVEDFRKMRETVQYFKDNKAQIFEDMEASAKMGKEILDHAEKILAELRRGEG